MSMELEETKKELESQRVLYEQAKEELDRLYQKLKEQEQLQKN
ncbi:hypothetical protein ACT7C7_05485 [Bacillus cereus]